MPKFAGTDDAQSHIFVKRAVRPQNWFTSAPCPEDF